MDVLNICRGKIREEKSMAMQQNIVGTLGHPVIRRKNHVEP